MSTVLLPLDGSASSLYGVRHVIDAFSKGERPQIHVVNVQRPFSWHVTRFTTRQARAAFQREQAETALAAARRALDACGVSYAIHFEVGDTAECIANAARRLRCDRIVIGTARKSSLVRMVESSVTNKVIEQATVPVEVISGEAASRLERIGIPAGVGTGIAALWSAAVD